jgi:SiaC family regulatory phosphoprotein
MKPLEITPTFSTPSVKLDAETGILQFEGRSIPEDAEVFYVPILSWLEEYYKKPVPVTNLNFRLDYVNSGSSKYLLELFRIIGRNYRDGHECLVTWYYEEEDEALQDLGDHYRTTIKIPFEFKVIKEEDIE